MQTDDLDSAEQGSISRSHKAEISSLHLILKSSSKAYMLCIFQETIINHQGRTGHGTTQGGLNFLLGHQLQWVHHHLLLPCYPSFLYTDLKPSSRLSNIIYPILICCVYYLFQQVDKDSIISPDLFSSLFHCIHHPKLVCSCYILVSNLRFFTVL